MGGFGFRFWVSVLGLGFGFRFLVLGFVLGFWVMLQEP